MIAACANGWLAAWIVCVSYAVPCLWSAVGVTLITLNQPVSIRILGHLHLFKFGWTVLAVWAVRRVLAKTGLVAGAALGPGGRTLRFRARFTWGSSPGWGWGSVTSPWCWLAG